MLVIVNVTDPDVLVVVLSQSPAKLLPRPRVELSDPYEIVDKPPNQVGVAFNPELDNDQLQFDELL